MSRSTLQHLFHKEFGCGPMEYFSRMKIRRAREMMREENCNITEIAARLSYGSVQYFSRQFKKEMGMSPAGKTPVSWNFTTMPSEEWKNGVGSALLEYAQGTGDWDAVVTAFVDGWKTEYDAAHAE